MIFHSSKWYGDSGNLKATLELEKHKEIALYVLIELLSLFSLVPFSCIVIAKSSVLKKKKKVWKILIKRKKIFFSFPIVG